MPIVTDGLVGYWHYQQGVSGSTWENIAPTTKGQYDGDISGAVLQSNGLYFDGDDVVTFPSLDVTGNITIEINFSPESNPFVSIIGYMGVNNHMIRIESSNFYRIFPVLNGSLTMNLINNMFSIDSPNHYAYTWGNRQDKSYANGSLVGNASRLTAPTWNQSFGLGKIYSSYGGYKGSIKSLRIYNRVLSEQEVLQNYSVGDGVGLDEEPPSQNPPIPTVNYRSRDRLSRVTNIDRSIVRFTFDQDVTEWRVRTIGTDHETGILADSGGAVSSGTEISAEIDHTELYQEGQNRINIYGKNAEGLWTPYSN